MERLGTIVLTAASVFGLAMGTALAQEGDEIEAAPPPAARERAPAAEPVEQVEEIPDARKASRSRENLDRMRAVLSRVLKYLADARDERDVVKLNCVNEKLTAIKGLLKISEQADVTLQEALARRDTEVAQHEYEKISIALRKCEQLLAESEACVGELAVYAGDTQIEVIIENVPEEDPTEDEEDPADIVRPPAASPYQ